MISLASLFKIIMSICVFSLNASSGVLKSQICSRCSPQSVLIPLESTVVITIPPQASLFFIADHLVNAHVIKNKWAFLFYVFVMRVRRKLQAGQYRFLKGVSIKDAVSCLVKGQVVIHKVTIPEGVTVHRAIKIIDKNPCLEGEILKIPQEGYILPGTYYFSQGGLKQEILTRMETEMKKKLEEYSKISKSLKGEDLLILASIVEKETQQPEERGLVAGVFLRRLQKGMKLQADPTIIYGITKGKTTLKRALTRSDWKFPSSFNTYLHDGLTPTPICCPGQETLKAVAEAVPGKYLFFVSNGHGSHLFSENLLEHNQSCLRR